MLTLALRRAGVALLTGAVASAGLVSAGLPPAQAATSTQAEAAADWLIGRLDTGHLLTYENWGTPSTDVGLSIDLALGLQQIGGHDADVASIAAAVEERAASYAKHDTGSVTWDCSTFAEIPETPFDSYYSNATAKAVVGLTATGRTGTTLDGLVDQLETVTIDDGADAGRITDSTVQGGVERPDCDYANVYGQAFAVRGLDAVGSAEEDAAVGYLLAQQNADGSWSEALQPVGGAKPDPDPAADATATAITQLQAITPSATKAAAVTTAIEKGVAWLVGAQAADGSFGGGTGSFGPNVNETGLAAVALANAGKAAAADRGATWIERRQVGSATFGAAGALAGDEGAVAYNDTAVDDGRLDGITAAAEGQWLRSSVQAVPALAQRGTAVAATVAATAAANVYGRPAPVQVTVTGTKTGTVVVRRGSDQLATANLTNGVATLVVPAKRLAPGTHNLTVVFTGNAEVTQGTTTVPLVVSKAPSTAKLKVLTDPVHVRRTNAKLRVTVVGAHAVAATGKVVLKVTGQKSVTHTLKGGRTTFTIQRFTTRGSKSVKVTYRGSHLLKPDGVSGKVKVVR